MSPYTLTVCHEGKHLPTEVTTHDSARAAMDAIGALLQKHPDCHRIHVHAGGARLFSVDCTGQNVTQ